MDKDLEDGLLERIFMFHAIEDNARLDGRSNECYRPPEVLLGINENCSGSARCTMGGSDVMVVIKPDIYKLTKNEPSWDDYIKFYVTCSPVAHPKYDDVGDDNDIEGEEISATEEGIMQNALMAMFSSIKDEMDFTNFRISKKHIWTFNVDVVVHADNGAVFDCMAIAVRAAFADVQVPLILSTMIDYGEIGLEIDSNVSYWKCKWDLWPLICTTNKLGFENLVNCNRYEDKYVKSLLMIGLKHDEVIDGNIPDYEEMNYDISKHIFYAKMRKEGGLQILSIDDMTDLGIRVALKMFAEVDRLIRNGLEAKSKKTDMISNRNITYLLSFIIISTKYFFVAMGVPGLWSIVDEHGIKVDLKSLEGLRLAIDVSIWIYQSEEIFKFQNSTPSSHLLLLIKRISKLLFYKIRPVFVFDGPNIPDVKRKTLSDRKLQQYVTEDRKKTKIFQDFLTKQKIPSVNKGKNDDIFEVSGPNSLQKLDTTVFEDNREKYEATSEDELMDLIKKKEELRKSRISYEELNKDAVEFSEGQLARILKKRSYAKRIETLIDNKGKQIFGKDNYSKNFDMVIDPVLGIHSIPKKIKSTEEIEMRKDKPSFSITALQTFNETPLLKRTTKKDDKIYHQDDDSEEDSDESEWEDVLLDEEEFEISDNEELGVVDEDSIDMVSVKNYIVNNDSTLNNERYLEFQQILDALGLPYITAYGEAEAECINLEKAKLVDGIVSDDSDVFLFGCQKVYKNMFSRSKELRCFKMNTIIEKMKYNRFSFISMAMFSGGDYSEGFYGIGIKSAEKIINEFCENKELINIENANDILDICNRFKKFIKENGSRPVVSQKRMIIINNFFKQRDKNLKLLTSFPSHDAVKEYCNPKCLRSLPEKFTWSRINYNSLQTAFLDKINWSIEEFHKNTFNSFSKWDEFMASDMLLRYFLYSVFLLLSILINPITTTVDSLYALDDPVLQLDITNFNQTVYDQINPKAYFIQFYSSWCGHCQHFKPTWVKFGKHLESWKDVVPITVINCADDKNSPICREHAIDAFPTIKYFKFGSKNKDDGISFQGDKYNIESMAKDLSKLVHEDWENQKHPPHFAHFNEVTESDVNIDSLFQRAHESKYIAILIEKLTTPISYSTSISYNSDPRITVFYSTSDQKMISTLNQNVIEYNLPKLLIYQKGTIDPVYSSTERMENIFDISSRINEILSDTILVAHPPKLAVEMEEKEIVKPIVPINKNQFKVQYGDLLSAIKYMLYTEIPRKPVLDGVKLQSLKAWIHMLKKYVPGTTPIRRFFYRLDEWLQLKPNAITSDEWIVKLNELQLQLGNPIPFSINWVACKGSKSYLRGYTCGLWTLMHTVTVEAFTTSKNDPNFSPKNDVLEPIKGFIVNYLSCEICAKNFKHMTEKNHLELVTRPEDVVLWLWRAHNNVNRRLSGEASEDPMFPKRQFPNSEICPKCIINESDGTYDENETLQYLLTYYRNIHKDGLTDEPAYKLLEFENGKLMHEDEKHLPNIVEPILKNVDKDEESIINVVGAIVSATEDDLHRNSGSSNTSGRSSNALIWLIIVGIMCLIIYTKYRQNRYRVWKIINNYNDYKLFGRDTVPGGKGKYEV
uniref:Sulfhydryl oxidase n=1 Tax=Parastrongyloides trichosuri TaxID=131310 RepID=A0A0N4Z0J0_PARTI